MAGFENEQKETAPSDSGNPFIAAFETGKHYRVHWSYMLLGPIIALIIVIVLTALSGLAETLISALEVLENVTGPFADLVVLLVLLVPFVLRWRAMSYVFDDREFSFYSGVFTKDSMHVPYGRIQSINYHASIIQRIFGACTITLDCAGGPATKTVRMPYVKMKLAERMRTELSMRKAAVEAGKEASVEYNPDVKMTAFGNEPISYEYRLKAGDLLKAAATNDKPVIVAFVVLIVAFIAVAVTMLLQVEFVEDVVDIAFLLIIAAVVIVWVFGLFPILSSYGGCRVRRRGSRIEIERGRLTRDFVAIDVNRIQSIEIKQSSIRRLIGCCELSFGRVSASNAKFSIIGFIKGLLPGKKKKKIKQAESVKGLVVHPCMKLEQVNDTLAQLAPELTDCPRREECKHLPKAALGRALIRECLITNVVFWVAVVFVVLWAITNVSLLPVIQFEDPEMVGKFSQLMIEMLIFIIAVAVILTIGRFLGARRWALRSGYAWNKRYLMLWNDGRTTNLVVIPRHKIQCGVAKCNFFQRRKSLATLGAVTVAGTRGAIASLVDVADEDVDAYLDWLKPRH